MNLYLAIFAKSLKISCYYFFLCLFICNCFPLNSCIYLHITLCNYLKPVFLPAASKVTEEVISNGHCVTANHGHGRKSICSGNNIHNNNNNSNNTTTTSHQNSVTTLVNNSAVSSSYSELDSRKQVAVDNKRQALLDDYQYMETQLAKQTVNDFEDSDESCERDKQPKSNGVACHAAAGTAQGRGGKWGGVKDSHAGGSRKNRNAAREVATSNFSAQKDDHTYRWVARVHIFFVCSAFIGLTEKSTFPFCWHKR